MASMIKEGGDRGGLRGLGPGLQGGRMRCCCVLASGCGKRRRTLILADLDV